MLSSRTNEPRNQTAINIALRCSRGSPFAVLSVTSSLTRSRTVFRKSPEPSNVTRSRPHFDPVSGGCNCMSSPRCRLSAISNTGSETIPPNCLANRLVFGLWRPGESVPRFSLEWAASNSTLDHRDAENQPLSQRATPRRLFGQHGLPRQDKFRRISEVEQEVASQRRAVRGDVVRAVAGNALPPAR